MIDSSKMDFAGAVIDLEEESKLLNESGRMPTVKLAR